MTWPARLKAMVNGALGALVVFGVLLLSHLVTHHASCF